VTPEKSLQRPATHKVSVMKLKYQALLGSLSLVAGLLLIPGFFYSNSEAYCFFWPGIDTRYASDYSERSFGRVEVGMTKDQVVELLGAPVRAHGFWRSHPAYKESGDEVWSYTGDGAAPWGDWAWLSREVIFRGNRVVQRVKWTYYD
jgi:hypothetical protein